MKIRLSQVSFLNKVFYSFVYFQTIILSLIYFLFYLWFTGRVSGLVLPKDLQRNFPVLPLIKDFATIWLAKQQRSEFSYRCDQCGKGYQHRATLLRHTRHECGKDPQFRCPYCAHRTKQRGNLYQHIRTNHPGKEVFCGEIGTN